MATDPITSGASAAGAHLPTIPAREPARGAGAASFVDILRTRLDAPRAHVAGEIGEVHAAIDAIRNGAALTDPVVATVRQGRMAFAVNAVTAIGGASATVALPSVQVTATAGAGDPNGWRSMARQIGDQVVAPGFGDLYERLIQQESGFLPEVAYGQRRSSAGAEGIAQLMPQYYPHVNRTDPQAALIAGAATLRHNLAATGGDVRQAMAAYNCGLGRVQQLVQAHGADWERGLPEETRYYLAAILGDAAPRVPAGDLAPAASQTAAVFGGQGPGGVLTPPLTEVGGWLAGGTGAEGLLTLIGRPGAPVLAPSDGRVSAISVHGLGSTVRLDHGRGWTTDLGDPGGALEAVTVSEGDRVARSQPLGTVGAAGRLGLSVGLDGRALDPLRYLLPMEL